MPHEILNAMKKKIGQTISKPIKAVGGSVLNALRKKRNFQKSQSDKIRNTVRLRAIKSAIKEGDYVFQKGDELLYPESIKYK